MMKIFFSGIGGSGLSAIAGFMAEKGHSVSGSDRLFDAMPDNPLCRTLRAGGISIFPQDGSGIDLSSDLAVFSTAVERDNPDFLRAKELGIGIKTRPECLAEIVSGFKTIAVAGTSGKSTMAGMLAFILQRLGLYPNFIGGGRVKQFITEKNPGNYLSGTSDILVIEACESDGTIVNYRPSFSIIANLDLDHHSVEETAAMFARLSENTSGVIIAGGDDLNLRSVGLRNPVRFSIKGDSEYKAEEIEFHSFKTSFTLHGQRYELSMPGRHNLYNALACLALLSEMGLDRKKIAQILPEFSGIVRRFDVHLNNGKYLVIDDYAHNPHKIRSLMETMQAISKKVCYIFQPHGYGPTRLMKEGYIRVFSENLRKNDQLFILPIYYAGGTASMDISSRHLAEGIRVSGNSVVTPESRKDILGMLGRSDSYVVFGARDDSLSDLAGKIAEELGKGPC